MKFSIGDIIALKQTGDEGVITGYIETGMYEVTVAGVAFPAYEDEMEHPYLKWFTDQKKNKQNTSRHHPDIPPPEKLNFHKERYPKGIFLSYLPVYTEHEIEEVVDELKIFLLNELHYPIRFRYELKQNDQQTFFHEGTLAAFSHVYLHRIPYDLMNDHPRFHWLVADADSSKGLKEKSGILRIKPAQLFQRIAKIQRTNEPTFSVLIADEFTTPEKPPVPLEYTKNTRIHKKRTQPANPFRDIPRYELDLHIQQIEPNYKQKKLSNAEILHIQVTHLEHYLRLAVAHRFDRMVIIHGLGRGTLRDAVHQVLRETPEVTHFANEWMGNYGFGATEVHFSY